MGPLGFWRTGTGLLSVGILTLLTSATRIPVHRTYTHGSQGQTFCHIKTLSTLSHLRHCITELLLRVGLKSLS